ncbi:hypothetical protein BX661DRAFT_185170 [Kickxella alabastrina]|uniref:uncharacterized protein n=1 Tax=Kickxella alabastrina TaxID=61397 RepID=UPI00221FDA6B|nr:uncharacterized protein BX661DRAFT_185170 [Kickxella alabastrina]KAI7825043.1 hypothetical protein BX661DRAFT_185170 [Kickxella alabastrina]
MVTNSSTTKNTSSSSTAAATSTSQSGQTSRASTVFRSLWKGQDRLVGSQGRFRVEVYLQMLNTLDWRSLGSLLVQLCQPLNDLPNNTNNRPQVSRCLVALAIALSHMQTVRMEESITPVNCKFVASVFATMMRATIWVVGDLPTTTEDPGLIALVQQQVFKAVAMALVVDKRGSDRAERFASEAVLDGLLGPSTADIGGGWSVNKAFVQPPPAKKQRAADSSTLSIEHADLLRLFARALSDKSAVRSDKYVVRILRARNGAVANRILGSDKEKPVYGASVAHQLFVLVGTLADRSSDILWPLQTGANNENAATQAKEDEGHIGGLFACVRDIIPSLRADLTQGTVSAQVTDQLLESINRLCVGLALVFRPYVLAGSGSGGTSVYAYCAQKKHRCYQWAALCRITTWVSCWGNLSATSQTMRESCAEAMAEGGRICWIQVAKSESYMSPSAAAAADPAIWLLVLSESLFSVALEYPHARIKPVSSKPPFTFSEDSQTQVFSLLAALLSLMGRSFVDLTATSAMRSLLLNCMAACDRIMRLVRPRAASLGLFQPCTLQSPFVGKDNNENAFSWFRCTAAEYIFRPMPLPSAEEASSASDAAERSKAGAGISQLETTGIDSIADQWREALEEIAHETRIANVFAAIEVLAKVVASSDSNGSCDSGMRSVLTMSFRTTLRWLSTYIVSARDNVGRQAELIDGQQRIKIRVVGDKVRLHRSATDWSRVQRVPTLRVDRVSDTESGDSNDAGNDAASDDRNADDAVIEQTTYTSMLARTLRLFAAFSTYKLLGDNFQLTLERCLVWSNDDPAAGECGAEHIVATCRAFNRLLSENDFRSVAFASLQILSGIVGVRSHLYTSEIDNLRLPHLCARGHSPRSSESMMQLAMHMGLGRLLLEPAFIVRCVQGTRDGRLLQSPLMICTVQIWLDMIGNIVRHSLFRVYLGFPANSKGRATFVDALAPSLGFMTWWGLALSAGVRCLLDVLRSVQGSGTGSSSQTRLAYILPSHLMSWHMYLPTTDSSIRNLGGFQQDAMPAPAAEAALTPSGCVEKEPTKSDIGQLYAWLLSFPHLEKSHSVVYIVYYLAAKLWLDVPALRASELSETTLRISRDVWGLGSDSIQLFVRLIHNPALWQVFVGLGLVSDFADVIKRLFLRQDLPNFLDDLVFQSPDDQHANLITFPLIDHDDEYGIKHKPAGAFPGGDLVDKLLHGALQLHRSAPKQRPAADYYSEPMLAQLWTTYVNNLFGLPINIVLHSTTGNYFDGGVAATNSASGSRMLAVESQADVLECLYDKSNALFDMFSPLLAVKTALSGPNVMWDAIDAALPVEMLLRAINVVDKSSIPKVCISAALILPDTLTARTRVPEISNITLFVASFLAQQMTRSDQDSGRCGEALLFLAWRQLPTILRQVALCTAKLEDVAICVAKQIGRLSASVLATLGTQHDTIDLLSSATMDANGSGSGALDLIILSGNDRDAAQPLIATSKALVVEHSPVFAAMVGGAFLEGQVEQGNTTQLNLQSNHAALFALFDIFHKYALVLHPTPDTQWDAEVPALLSAFAMVLDQQYSPDELAAVLDLAIYYDMRPVVALLAWHFSTKTASHTAFSGDTLAILAAVFGESWDSFLLGDKAAECAVRRSLAAIMILHLDEVDVVGVIGDSSDPLSDYAEFLFSSN